MLVERAAEHGMDTLALTDRDGAYGVVKFAKACAAAGVRPVFGVDLAVAPVRSTLPPAGGRGAPRRARSHRPARPAPAAPPAAAPSSTATPTGGAAGPDRGLPRVVLLARDGRGWAALCRLVSATHLAGERGAPVSTLDLVAEHAGSAAQAGALAVLLGPASELGPGRHRPTRRPRAGPPVPLARRPRP